MENVWFCREFDEVTTSMRVFTRRKKMPARLAPDAGAQELELMARRKILASVGATHFEHRDALVHLSERFFENFDLVNAMTGAEFEPTETESGKETEGGAAADLRSAADAGGFLMPRGAGGDNEEAGSGAKADSDFARRFRQVAFDRGHLIGAVMRGENAARLMFFSCLKRTVGQSEPRHFRQRKLFQSGASMQRNLEGRDAGKVIFNRGEPESAIAVAVSSLRNARNTVNALAAFARGEGGLPEASGAATLRKMYPFLNDEEDRSDIDVYGAMLSALADTPENTATRLVLRQAQFQARAVIEHKARLKHRFLRELENFSEKAEQAEHLFDSESLRREAIEGVALTARESPEDLEPENDAAQEPPESPEPEDAAAQGAPENPEPNGEPEGRT
jgi:hypothetical protein